MQRAVVGGVVQQLPAHSKFGRNAQVLDVRSTARERLGAWLQSEEGLAWRNERAELWQNLQAPDAN